MSLSWLIVKPWRNSTLTDIIPGKFKYTVHIVAFYWTFCYCWVLTDKYFTAGKLAWVADVIQPRLLTPQQHRYPCPGPQRTPRITGRLFRISFTLMGKSTMEFWTSESWSVLKSQHTGRVPEQGFRRCYEDGLNQSLVSSAAQATR